MAKAKRKSGLGLVSEAVKKAGRSIAAAASKAVGGKGRTKRTSAGGLMSEAVKKGGRGVGRSAKALVRSKSSRKK